MDLSNHPCISCLIIRPVGVKRPLTPALVNGDDVGIVTVRFGRSVPTNIRPDTLTVEYSINGIKERQEFENIAGGGQ